MAGGPASSAKVIEHQPRDDLARCSAGRGELPVVLPAILMHSTRMGMDRQLKRRLVLRRFLAVYGQARSLERAFYAVSSVGFSVRH